jgi:crotonobetainyl-CoA:carnitine CoA-transferase CaiB-like acyl-CoA transferase
MPQSNGDPMILEGCTVLDFTQYLAGAGVTRMMAELGADIVKVEIPEIGDPGRLLPRTVDGRSAWFVQHNRGKRSLSVDWDTPEGRELLIELARDVDIVAENFGSAGVMAKRGLDYESVRAVNPDVIYLSVSCFGRNSPWADRPGYDYIAQAVSGIMHMTGDPEGPPMFVSSALGDTNGAVHGFAALGYALYYRERTGRGQHLDIAMTDALFHFHESQLQIHHTSGGEYVPIRYGAHNDLVFPAGTFKAPQGYIVVLALDLQWENVCNCIGRRDLLDDPRLGTSVERVRYRDELVPIIEGWMAGFDTDEEVLEQLAAHRVPAGPVLSPLDAIDHPHFLARDMVRWVPDEQAGPIPIPGFPFKFGAQPELPDIRAALLGEHNEEVLTERLGLGPERVAELTAQGVLHKGKH